MGDSERAAGTVAELMWRDEDMELGQVCPYKVRAWRHALFKAPFLHSESLACVADQAGLWQYHLGACRCRPSHPQGDRRRAF